MRFIKDILIYWSSAYYLLLLLIIRESSFLSRRCVGSLSFVRRFYKALYGGFLVDVLLLLFPLFCFIDCSMSWFSSTTISKSFAEIFVLFLFAVWYGEIPVFALGLELLVEILLRLLLFWLRESISLELADFKFDRGFLDENKEFFSELLMQTKGNGLHDTGWD